MPRGHDRARASSRLAHGAAPRESIKHSHRSKSGGQREPFAHRGILFPVGCLEDTDGLRQHALDGRAHGVVGRFTVESNDRLALSSKAGVSLTVGQNDQSVTELVNRKHSPNAHNPISTGGMSERQRPIKSASSKRSESERRPPPPRCERRAILVDPDYPLRTRQRGCCFEVHSSEESHLSVTARHGLERTPLDCRTADREKRAFLFTSWRWRHNEIIKGDWSRQSCHARAS